MAKKRKRINPLPLPFPFPRPFPFPVPVGNEKVPCGDQQEFEVMHDGIIYNGVTGDPKADYNQPEE